MASEDRTVSLAVPAEVDDWLDAEAERRGEDRETVCRRLLAAAHSVSTDGTLEEPPGRDDLDELRAAVDAHREEFTELIEDVRSRVIQVKREADGKAPADHDHPELADAHDSFRADLERLEDDLATLEERTDAGFDNFEEVLEYLVDETDELTGRTTVLARAVVDLREHRNALAARERRRSEAEKLRLAANRLGIRTAACEECGSSVDVALLTAPECPHCASDFADVAEKASLFGSHTLETGDPPALEGRVEDAVATDDPDAVFEAVADAAADERDREVPR